LCISVRGLDVSEKQLAAVFREGLTVVLCVAALCATILVVTAFIAFALRDGPDHTDFFGIWSWARFEIERPPAMIYDHEAQRDFLLSLDLTYPVKTASRLVAMPFAYPPLFLLLIRPLGWLSLPVARALWSTATLLAYMAAVCSPSWRLRIVLPALLAPATAINLAVGQNGFLTAAFLVGGIRLAQSWPIAGGVLLGLLAYKPHFGLLVAIALVAARWWRTAAAAALTVVAAMAASLYAFGLEAWTAWANSLSDFVAILHLHRADLLPLMQTALTNALALGASDRLAEAIQFTATAAAAAAVWFAFRRTPPRPYPSPVSSTLGAEDGWGTAGRAAVLATASILASPYAFVYDMTLVAAAVALIVGEYWTTLSAGEVLVLGVAALLPAGMLVHATPPLGAAWLGLLLALILLRCRRAAFRASYDAVELGSADVQERPARFPLREKVAP
jgi:hypothetical protein